MRVVSAGVSRETPGGSITAISRACCSGDAVTLLSSPRAFCMELGPVRVAFHVKHTQACCGWRTTGYVGVQRLGLCAGSAWLTAFPEPYRHHAELNGRVDASMWPSRGGVIRGGPPADTSDATVYAQHYRARKSQKGGAAAADGSGRADLALPYWCRVRCRHPAEGR
jgi:hypothetical protein